MVGGVSPGKGGTTHLGLPVFDTVAEAREATGADASVIYVPPPGAADAICEAIDAEIPLIVCITEGIPVLDMVKVKRALDGSKSRLVGPNCPGVITPGECKIGIMPGNIFKRGQRRHRLALRHADLRSGVPDDAASASARRPRSASAAIRSRAWTSSTCSRCSSPTPRPKSIIMIGEIGGRPRRTRRSSSRTRRSAAARSRSSASSPAAPRRPGRRMGHAGAIIAGGKGGAEDKIAAMEAAGIRVSPSPARLGKTLVDVLNGK